MKKDYLKKIVSLGLIVSMAAVLGGCGASGSSGGSTGTAGEREYTFTFAEHVANVKEQAPQVYAVVKAYEDAHPNVKIDLQRPGPGCWPAGWGFPMCPPWPPPAVTCPPVFICSFVNPLPW